MTQLEHVGFDSIGILDSISKEYDARNIFLLTDKESYNSSGVESRLKAFLSGRVVEHFCDFSCNPKLDDVRRGVKQLVTADNIDLVLAVGGGSVLDMAKLVNFFASNRQDPKEYLAQTPSDVIKPRPLVAIPTTAGTGSEATHFAVLYIDKVKHSVAHPYILPEIAIVDPNLTMSLPPYTTASTGMDALAQAIESYWSVHSNDESRRYAGQAIELIWPSLSVAVKTPTKNARLAMAKAAHLAGKAINITKTTAAHAVSYPITSYFGVAHGHAVALTLSSLLAYNFEVTEDDVSDPRGCSYVQATIKEIASMLGAADVSKAKESLNKLMNTIGLESHLSRLDINSSEDIEKIIDKGFDPERVVNNPRNLTADKLREILFSLC